MDGEQTAPRAGARHFSAGFRGLALVSRSEISTGDSCRFICEIVGRLVGAVDADAIASLWCEVRDEPLVDLIQSVELDDVLSGVAIVAEDDGVSSLDWLRRMWPS
jgi:hypothetical protein